MALLREVIAKFAVEVDGKELNKLDRQIDYLKDKFEKVGRVAAATFAAGAFGAYKFVEAASSADEALNVLQRTFGKQADEVLKWSKVAGGEMSRSMYEMQDAAGRFGAFLQPQFKDTTTDIAAMSMALTRLSVDLASFYNTSDQEAAMRLFSGLSGETEAVRRLGIDISDTALDAFNKQYGDATTNKKRMAALSLQEKTLLRYKKILKDTVDKQNDAILTADSWANRLKALQGRFNEVSVEQGRKLIPFFKTLLGYAERGIDLFERLANKTTVFRDAMIAAAAAYALVNARALATNATIALTLAAVQDFAAFNNDQDSFFGDFLTEITGLQNPLKALRDTMMDIMRLVENFISAVKAAVDYVSSIGGNLSKMPGNLLESITPDFMQPIVNSALDNPLEAGTPDLFKREEYDKRDWDQTLLDSGYMSLAEHHSRVELARRAAQKAALVTGSRAQYIEHRGEQSWEEADLEYMQKRPIHLRDNPKDLTEEDLKLGTNALMANPYLMDASKLSSQWAGDMTPTGIGRPPVIGPGDMTPVDPLEAYSGGALALPPSMPMSSSSLDQAYMSQPVTTININQTSKVDVSGVTGTIADQMSKGVAQGNKKPMEQLVMNIAAAQTRLGRKAKVAR